MVPGPRQDHDKRILALVKAFLKAGVLTTAGTTEGTITGTPQGGILSLLLANIALSVLDDHFAQQWQETMSTEVQRQKRRRKGEANTVSFGSRRLRRRRDRGTESR